MVLALLMIRRSRLEVPASVFAVPNTVSNICDSDKWVDRRARRGRTWLFFGQMKGKLGDAMSRKAENAGRFFASALVVNWLCTLPRWDLGD